MFFIFEIHLHINLCITQCLFCFEFLQKYSLPNQTKPNQTPSQTKSSFRLVLGFKSYYLLTLGVQTGLQLESFSLMNLYGCCTSYIVKMAKISFFIRHFEIVRNTADL